jgi:hypothetical protein
MTMHQESGVRLLICVSIVTPPEARPRHDLFGVACNTGLEGIVSERLDRAYGGGKCAHWPKIKNPAHPAYNRVRDKLLQSPLSRRKFAQWVISTSSGFASSVNPPSALASRC